MRLTPWRPAWPIRTARRRSEDEDPDRCCDWWPPPARMTDLRRGADGHLRARRTALAGLWGRAAHRIRCQRRRRRTDPAARARMHKRCKRVHTTALIAALALTPAVAAASFVPEPTWLDTAAWLSVSTAWSTALLAIRGARRAKPAPGRATTSISSSGERRFLT